MSKYREMFVLRLVGGREQNWYDWPWDCLEEIYWDSPQYLFMSIYDNYCSFGNYNYVERVLIPKPAVINENKEGGICLPGNFFFPQHIWSFAWCQSEQHHILIIGPYENWHWVFMAISCLITSSDLSPRALFFDALIKHWLLFWGCYVSQSVCLFLCLPLLFSAASGPDLQS